MIAVTRLNGSRFAVNPDLIERVQENPDTTLVMVAGATYVVRESLPEVIALIADFRALVLATAQSLSKGGEARQLTVLRPPSTDPTDTAGQVATATPLRPAER